MAAPRHHDAMLDQSAADRTTRAAKHALLTCALAFGQSEGGQRDVLFAVARSYAAAERASYGDDGLASNRVEVDEGQSVRTSLESAQGDLCAAAKALPRFSRHTVRRLVRAARSYADAWDLDRLWAAHLAHCRASSTYAGGAQSRSNSSADPAVNPSLARSRHVVAECRYSRRPSRP